MDLPSQLFTIESLTTFSGLSGIVFIICNSIKAIFNYMRKWLVFLLSISLSIFAVSLTDTPSFTECFFGTINGCLIALAALGGNSVFKSSSNVVEEIIDPSDSRIQNNKVKQWFSRDWSSI